MYCLSTLMLGKRAAGGRTSSMTEFTLDFTGSAVDSLQGIGSPDFLRVCGLCKSRLIPGRDIYMYRGDSAFCSVECRQHQMTQDQMKHKSYFKKLASNNQVPIVPGGHPPQVPSTTTTAV